MFPNWISVVAVLFQVAALFNITAAAHASAKAGAFYFKMSFFFVALAVWLLQQPDDGVDRFSRAGLLIACVLSVVVGSAFYLHMRWRLKYRMNKAHNNVIISRAREIARDDPEKYGAQGYRTAEYNDLILTILEEMADNELRKMWFLQ